MREVRPVFFVLAILVVGLFCGTMLEKLVLQPRTAGQGPGEEEGPGEQQTPVQGSCTDFYDIGGFGGFGGFEYEPPEIWLTRQIWVEAKFIEIDTTEFEEITTGDGPASEKLLLTPEEKRDLLRRLKSKPSFRTVGSASVTTISGQQALMQIVESVPYFTEKESPDKAKEEHNEGDGTQTEVPAGSSPFFYVAPVVVEETELGVRLNVTPTISSDGTTITLVILPEVSYVTGWADLGGGGAPLPFIQSHNVTTTIYTRDGLTFVMTSNPVGDFGGAPPPDLKPEPKPAEEKTIIVLITARLIEIPLEDEEALENHLGPDFDRLAP